MRPSGVFCDLLSSPLITPSIDPQAEPKPIYIDADDVELELFLDLLWNKAKGGLYTSSDYVHVARLADQYDCPYLFERIRLRLIQSQVDKPWAVFVLASQKEDVELAKWALKGMAVSQGEGVDWIRHGLKNAQPAGDLSNVPLSYAMGFAASMDRHRDAFQIRYAHNFANLRWDLLSDTFTPFQL
jgi:hypothetical protein